MTDQPTFEQSLAALEEAVAKLEKGQLPLDEALACFETGVRSATRCRALLQEVEGRVELLLQGADGVLRTEPFAAAGDSGED